MESVLIVPADVRYWQKRTCAGALHMSAIEGKADMAFCAAMSAYDPKRTWHYQNTSFRLRPRVVRFPCPEREGRHMRRREFITLLGGAAAVLPSYATWAQQQIPLVGFLNSASPDTYRFNANSFREGLTKAGFIEGRNVRIEERWARRGLRGVAGSCR